MIRLIRKVRGLAIVPLTILLISTYNVKIVKADTIDDLRAYLGKTVELRKDTSNKYVVVQGENSNETVDKSEYEEIVEKISRLESKYSGELGNGTRAKDIKLILEEIVLMKNKAEEFSGVYTMLSNIETSKLLDNNVAFQIDFGSSGKFGSYSYDIGLIGDRAISPVGRALILVTPYGYKLESNGSYSKKNNFIDLAIQEGNDVYSQWNGKIAYIEKDEIEGLKTITIFHGNGLYTVYKHIEQDSLYVGKVVTQGDSIGKIGNTSENEVGKNNHLSYGVVLDGKYINPLIVYGLRGKGIYTDWLYKTNNVYTVENGDEFYYVEEISKVNPNSLEPDYNTIDGAVEVIGEYKRPDPGVVR